ncbi:MAG TPA: adenylate/guanylate cyclase domain-containing protein [Anaerolineales bacterium]|nr:adenylate/guanylate cyclase domain-containing protein [Anaerolineales bacterium]
MANLYHVIILQSDLAAVQSLSDFFTQRGDLVSPTTDPNEANALLRRRPDLAILDLHLSDNQLAAFLQEARQESPDTKILVTSQYPDAERELQAKEQGAQVFLQPPFTRSRVERALHRLEPIPAEAQQAALAQVPLPRVRLPVRIKLTLPYVLLAAAFAAAAAYLVNRYVLESVQDRFARQLSEAGILTADSMVAEERKLLETLRYVANTQGVPDAVVAAEAELLRDIALPIAVNKQDEAVEILDLRGVSLLSLRHMAQGGLGDYEVKRGEEVFGQWDFVQNVLAQTVDDQGDKYAGLARAPWGDYFYVAGPIKDQSSQLVGVILVGKSLPTLVRQIRQETLAHITLYDSNGQLLASTFEQDLAALTPEEVRAALEQQDQSSHIRNFDLPGGKYSEIVGPWEARGGGDIGLIGTSLTQGLLVRPTQITVVQAYVVVTIAFLLVIFVGVYLANQITRLLLQVTRASAQVAQGNLDIKVASRGDDEVALLANSFNVMVSRLQEGSVYRDLLGRAVSPEVREQLRRSFESGDLRLEGQTTEATVMMTDIRSFTTVSERQEPTTVLRWLNEYFGELVPIVTAYGGVVDKFEGDAMLAFFGLLPSPLGPQESAYNACQAAQEMLEVIDQLNAQREKRGDPPFITGIGINTGPVTAGGLGTADRLSYTVIGDTVNTVQRLESFTRQLGASSAVIGQTTYEALQDKQFELNLEALGSFSLKGKREAVSIYRLRSSRG